MNRGTSGTKGSRESLTDSQHFEEGGEAPGIKTKIFHHKDQTFAPDEAHWKRFRFKSMLDICSLSAERHLGAELVKQYELLASFGFSFTIWGTCKTWEP